MYMHHIVAVQWPVVGHFPFPSYGSAMNMEYIYYFIAVKYRVLFNISVV